MKSKLICFIILGLTWSCSQTANKKPGDANLSESENLNQFFHDSFEKKP